MGGSDTLGETGSYDGVFSFYAILIAVNLGGKIQQEKVIRVLVNVRGTAGERETKKINESVLQREKHGLIFGFF